MGRKNQVGCQMALAYQGFQQCRHREAAFYQIRQENSVLRVWKRADKFYEMLIGSVEGTVRPGEQSDRIGKIDMFQQLPVVIFEHCLQEWQLVTDIFDPADKITRILGGPAIQSEPMNFVIVPNAKDDVHRVALFEAVENLLYGGPVVFMEHALTELAVLEKAIVFQIQND
jgi:hypothetical protein